VQALPGPNENGDENDDSDPADETDDAEDPSRKPEDQT